MNINTHGSSYKVNCENPLAQLKSKTNKQLLLRSVFGKVEFRFIWAENLTKLSTKFRDNGKKDVAFCAFGLGSFLLRFLVGWKMPVVWDFGCVLL